MSWKNVRHFARATVLALLVLFCFGAAGEICGFFFETTAAAFDSKFPDNRAEDLAPLLPRLQPQPAAGPSNSAGKPLAVLLTDGDPRTLVAIDLTSGQPLWKATPPVQSELTVEGDLLVFLSGFEVVGHGLLDGQERWRVETDRKSTRLNSSHYS